MGLFRRAADRIRFYLCFVVNPGEDGEDMQFGDEDWALSRQYIELGRQKPVASR